MGIFDRLSTVFKSNVNELIDKVEDPEKMLKQLLIDMETDLINVRKEVAMSIQTEKRLHQQYLQNDEQSRQWEEKATLALQKGREDLAKEALTRRNTYQTTGEGFKAQWETQHKNVEMLKGKLTQLEQKINEARIKKDLLIARSRQAKAQEQIGKTMGKIGQSSSLSAFARMEDKVSEKEALAAAYDDLGALGGGVEEEFAQLESGSSVDDDLAALKAKLSGGSPSSPSV